MGQGIAATVSLDEAPIRALFARLADFPSQLAPAADEIGEAMVSATQRRINAETGPDGQKWEKSQRVKKHGGITLKETGRHIFRALVHNVLSAASSGISVEWGVNTPWAWVHQLGALLYHRARTTTINRKVKDGAILPGFVKARQSNFQTEHAVGNHAVIIPARPFVGVDGQDRAEISDILGRFLSRALTGGAA